ncbi:glycosyltransferase family 4 protein [Limnobacter sp. P1]|uniref:glycosyltransferase family 4 protein n=1 Tax=Limnobacter olei TaxID=3031298 RepID=UPI0023B0BD4C|nr:glycosyltransferase family 4 protein [Limnobacter sp. P1]
MERSSLNLWQEFKLLIWLHRLMKHENIDLVHSFTIKCVVYGSIAARLSGVEARVSAVAGMGYVFTSQNLKAKLLRPLVRLLLRVALGGKNSLLILQNPDDVGLFRQARLVDSNQVRLIPGSGVDCNRFIPQPCISASMADEPVQLRVLFPARLLWDKGLAEFIQATQLLLQEGRRIEFLLAGNPDPGNPASASEDEVQQWVNKGWIRWLGHVDDMPRLFNAVDVVVLPSYREGLPKGLIEAAASAKALVTTNAPGCRNVVDHEINGLLIPPKDHMALAFAIARLDDDPVLRTTLGNAARVKALQCFDERLVIQNTLNVYRELLPQPII